MIGVHSTIKNLRASLVALMTLCVARAGERLRVSSRSLPITRREVLPSGMHKPWAGSNRYKISELIAVHRRMATPGRFTLTTFLCTLQGATSDSVLIRTLQHSILGTWLTLTQAGVTPASHQTISSPHAATHCYPPFGSGQRQQQTDALFDLSQLFGRQVAKFAN